jgi:ketosteroid isomerase-like protein
MTTNQRLVLLAVFCLAFAATRLAANDSPAAAAEDLAASLRDTEIAFATTMADRDHGAFVGFLADETIFFSGDSELRGREAVAAAWKPFFDGPGAPFSWRPEVVAVLDSGTLGLTSGPVLDREGSRIGTFNSIWRRTADGGWEIVFDRGCRYCGD